jgi:hypothetical protein
MAASGQGRSARIAGSRTGWVIGALVVVATGLGAGCSGTEVPIEPVVPGSPALELSAQVSPSTFVQGDSTTITVTLRNVSTQPVRVSFANTCTIVYAVRTVGGTLVVPSGGGWACEPFSSRITLDRLEATQRTFIWRGEGIPAGTYIVYGALGGDLAVISPGVAVTLTAPPPPPTSP